LSAKLFRPKWSFVKLVPDGQREDGVGVAVAVAVVRLPAAVAGSPHEDGAQLLAAVEDAVGESLLGEGPWSRFYETVSAEFYG
jgi:hypothetical protein